MKNETVRLNQKDQVVDFIRTIGPQCFWIVADTQTCMDQEMRKFNPTGRKILSPKTGKPINEKVANPYMGTIKFAKRNGFVNANFVKACEKRYAEQNGLQADEVEYTPGKTWYRHCQDEQGRPLALSEHAGDPSRKYMQLFPFRNLGETVYVSPTLGKLTPAQVADMYENWVNEKEQEDWKPRVIVLAIDSIRSITFRRVRILNETANRIANRLARLKGHKVSTRPPVVAAEVA